MRASDFSAAEFEVVYWLANSLPFHLTPARYVRIAWLNRFKPQSNPTIFVKIEATNPRLLIGKESECLYGFTKARVMAIIKWESPILKWLYVNAYDQDDGTIKELQGAVSVSQSKRLKLNAETIEQWLNCNKRRLWTRKIDGEYSRKAERLSNTAETTVFKKEALETHTIRQFHTKVGIHLEPYRIAAYNKIRDRTLSILDLSQSKRLKLGAETIEQWLNCNKRRLWTRKIDGEYSRNGRKIVKHS
ncbi:hypothetical protein GJ496_006262 [Pomphorhynchus laevis]|nr:hypothetical protein GJ496_006262 [Pomphorhynchus laevis]